MASFKPVLILVAFWLCLSIPLKSVSQNNIRFTSLTVKEGMPSNTVKTILKDHYGMIWFGTSNGLTRFDGTNFYTYRHEPDNRYSLPGNEVQATFEAKDGTIWVGTNVGGVYCYNRKYDRFEKFTGDGSWPGINGITVRCFAQDHTGKIWIATYGDLRTVDPATGKIQKVNLDCPESDLASFVVLAVLEDSRNRLWVGTNTGLYLYNWKNNSFQRFIHNANAPNSISNSTIKQITEDSNGNIWFGTLVGINEWLSAGHFKHFQHDESNNTSLSNDIIYGLSADKDGKLWVGTEDGLNIYNPANQTFKRINTDPRNSYALKSGSIRSILIDSRGIYWVGTYGGGVSKFDEHLPLFNRVHSNPFDPQGLKVPTVTSFAYYSPTQVFVGTDGAGVEVFNPITGLFKSFNIRSRLSLNKKGLSVLALYLDGKNQLWASTYNDGLFCIDPQTGSYKQFVQDGTANGPSFNQITSMAQDKAGNIWFGTLGKGIGCYNQQTGRFITMSGKTNEQPKAYRLPLNDYIEAVRCADNGDIWIGSIGTGVAVYHPASGKFDQYTKENSGLADNVVQCLTITSKGDIWIGTNQGVSYFDPHTNRFISYNEKNGLGDGFVKTIIEDNHGLLWLGTEKGISSFDRKRLILKNYNSSNGALQSSYMSSAGIKTPNDEIFFGGQDGFNFFRPEELPSPPIPGRVMLTELRVNNVAVVPGEKSPISEQIGTAKEIVLNYGQNFLLRYVDLDYTSAKQDKYSYRLIGFEKQWNDISHQALANYTNIDPGEYLFEVKAINKELNWSSPVTTIKIIVQPPFWRTTTAYLIYILVIGGGLFLLRRQGIRKIHREFELKQEKLQFEQMIQAERREAERTKDLDNAKIKFLTDLSHEFRTPISLIAAPVEKLLNGSPASAGRGELRAIDRNVKRLLNLVNQLLDFRKLEQNKLQLNLQPGNINQFVYNTAEAFRVIAIKKQITLSVKIATDCYCVLFDPEKIERVIFNLLSNAFKFTPDGGEVTLQSELVTETNGQKQLILSVTDTGKGADEKDLSRIFDRFYQASQPGEILNQGSGIGLAITKEFVELHGGTIQAEKIAQKGLKFLARIPMPLIAQNELTVLDTPNEADVLLETEVMPADAMEMANPNKSITLLLVEDNNEFRDYLVDHLGKFYNIVEASDGREGWQKTLSAHPQLVISDISMPVMNGVELSKKIKRDKRTAHIPVILLTATAGEENQLEALQSGANDYLTKPFNFQLLNVRIENLLTLNKSLKDTYSKQIHLTPQQIETESTDVRLLNQVMNYVEEKLSDCELSVEELSKHVGMSRTSLYYKMIELTGVAPTEYMRGIKLEKAASLLESSDLNVSQIAYMTGFATPSYFSKMFKARFGKSPIEYLAEKRTRDKVVNDCSYA